MKIKFFLSCLLIFSVFMLCQSFANPQNSANDFHYLKTQNASPQRKNNTNEVGVMSFADSEIGQKSQSETRQIYSGDKMLMSYRKLECPYDYG